MNKEHTSRQPIAVAAIIAIGLVLAALILTMRPAAQSAEDGHGEHAEESEHAEKPDHDEAEPAKGRHGGKLFTNGSYSLEVTIFEQNVEPHFRLFAYQDGKPLPPSASKVTATIERLGAAPQTMSFVPEADYLKGNGPLEEPHSFKVGLQADAGGKRHQFSYEQVEARVTMSEQQVAHNGIAIHTSGPARIKSVLTLIGEIQLNADRSVQVSPRLAGVVESVRANAGDIVRKGQVLAVISSQALATERGALKGAQQRVQLTRAAFEREQKLWQEKISARQDYEQARAAFEEANIAHQLARQRLAALGAGEGSAGQLALHEIRAPIDGVVTTKSITVGEGIAEDAAIFVVSDLSTVWAEVAVGEREVDTIKPGQAAVVLANGTEARASGKVSFVSPVVGEQTRAARARVVLPNPQRQWRPGSVVRVGITAAETAVPVAVRSESVQTVRDEPAVFGRYGDQFEARPVVLGRTDGQYVEVVEGLPAGVKYAAKNSFLIKADIGKSGASHDH